MASADRDEEATPSKEENVIDDTEANSDTDVAEVSEQLDFSKSTCDIQLEAAARADEDGNDTNSEDDSLEGTSPPHDVSALSAALSADDETPDATVDPKQSIKARSVDAPEGLFAAVKRRREANLAKIKAVVTAGKEKTSQLISKSSSFRYPTSNENVASAEHSSNSPEALAAGNTDNISSAGRRRSSSGANYLKSTTTQLTSMARATIHAERLTNLNESIHKMGSTINSMSSGITTITRSRANTNKSPVNATTDDEVAPDSSSACQSSSFEEEIRSIMQSSSKVGDKNEEAQTRVRRRSIHNRMVHTSSIANETSPSVKTVPMVVKDSAKIASRDELECNISDRSNAESSTNRRKSIDSEASVHRSRVDSNGAENQNFVSDAATSEDDLIDTMLSLELVKPHIAMIMDRTVQASAGMELFTFSLGEEDSQSTKNGNSTNSQTMTEKDSSGTAQSQKIRCPIRIFTATPVKLSIQASTRNCFLLCY